MQQRQLEHKPDCFVERFLGNEAVKRQFPSRGLLYDLRDALNGKVIEVKVDEFGAEGIENAKRDFLDQRRCALLLQAVVDELYRVKSLGRPPEVQPTIRPAENESGLVRVTWNIDLEELSRHVGAKLAFGHSLALSGALIGNTYLWSAQRQNCDLYLPRPISVIVGDKLYEAGQTLTKTPTKAQSVVDQLESEVEFPDLQRWVNEGKIEFKEVLKMRKKAKRFRHWLQTEADKDRNAMVFYMQEAAKESGFTKTGRISVNMFGVIGGGVVGNLIGSALSADPTTSSYIGSAAGGTITYLLDLASKFRSGWKPYVFGDWYKARIEKLLAKQDEDNEDEEQ